ncbi:MAG: helix-turn-helix transcriptional regulator [Hyphomicrobiaceae bacterium]|nr:helix-turn-helix transcriptional regulator [Hyphomicrobiaceae bacterium]
MVEHSPPGDRDAALAVIRTAMVEKKLTQAELADAADCHEKTVQNLLSGRSVREQTLFDVCMVLGLDYRRVREAWAGAATSGPMELKGDGGLVAPVYMGAYSQAAVDHYIGTYVTIRPSFTRTGRIVAFRTEIHWDPSWPSLLFQERDRPDVAYQHRGRIYVPASSMFIHLVSLTKGAMRMVMVSQLDQNLQMRGLITTLNRQGAMLVPVASPIVYVREDRLEGAHLGELGPEDACHEPYRRLLEDTIAEGYARLVAC